MWNIKELNIDNTNRDKIKLDNIEYCNKVSSELLWLLEWESWTIKLEKNSKDILYYIAKDLVRILEYGQRPLQLWDRYKEQFNEKIKEYRKELEFNY